MNAAETFPFLKTRSRHARDAANTTRLDGS